MNVELSDEDLQLVVRALDHYYAYTRATQREDHRFQMLSERLKVPRKPTSRSGAKKKTSSGRKK